METVLEWLLRELGETARKLEDGVDSAYRVLEDCVFESEYDRQFAVEGVDVLHDYPQELRDLVREARQRLKEGRIAA